MLNNRRRRVAAIAIISGFSLTCGGDRSSPMFDAAVTPPQIGFDGGSPPDDAGPISAQDDAGTPIPRDGGAPSRPDGGRADAGSDAGRPDAGDAGPPLPNLNPGWIGGACSNDAACGFANGFCLEEPQGFPGGMCTESCTRTCPDQAGPQNTVTFCIASPASSQTGGLCVSRCDFAKSPTGCRAGYHCETKQRFNDATVTQDVCMPGPPPPPTSNCPADVAALGLTWTPTVVADRSPTGYPNLTCHIESPGKLSSPVHGIPFKYSGTSSDPMTMGCALAKALEKLVVHLASLDIVEVHHLGTYNCRIITGSNPAALSEHGNGAAIDLSAFKHRDGTLFKLDPDYEMGNPNPTSRAGRFLYDLSRWMYTQRIFNIILTPDFNAAHRNHFHVDLTRGGHFLRKAGAPESEDFQSIIAPNNGH